ncbi:MAG: ice-binding family protein [Myxococcota bacterium]|nr:ice-binding family protein [Myxococcota bacterium]
MKTTRSFLLCLPLLAGALLVLACGPDNNPRNPTGEGPATVDLGKDGVGLAQAGAYVLLAKTGITNVTGSLITGGNLGLSPAAASFITGFSLIADGTNEFSTSSSVASPGRIYASDYASPTSSNLTQAVLNMQTAYTDAAGRSNPDELNLSGGNLGGLTLAPGLYTWGTAVTIPTDVTFAGGANDVWILQISEDLDLSSAKRVLLSGGAQAKNIFWQVAGQVTLRAGSHFEGVILSQTAITLQTNASLFGRALAQSLIALDDNAISAP